MEIHCRKHKATKESGSRPLHSHTGLPIDGTRKKSTCCEAVFTTVCQNKTQTQTTMQNIPFSDTFGSRDVEKCTSLWRKAHFEVKKMSNTLFRACCLSAGLRYFETYSSTNVEHTLGQATAGGLQRTCQNLFAQEQTFSLRSKSNCMSVGMHCYGLFPAPNRLWIHSTARTKEDPSSPRPRSAKSTTTIPAQRLTHSAFALAPNPWRTARLMWLGSIFFFGSCLPSASWQQRLRPCVGLCPLHRYSPSGDPVSP